MSREIDQRVVEMEFDNQEFERRISKTTHSLGKLKEALNLDDAADGFDQIQNSISRIDFSSIADIGVAALAKFKLISQVLDDVIGKTKQFVKSVTIDPVNQGWTKYADITKATQTIMAATAKDFANEADQIETVNAQLEKLNWFTDETSYNLTDMTNNIGKFTSNGVKLETAVTAMQGIGTWASISGQGIAEAGRAMYNLSQALGTGSIQVRDWMSIENANMATAEFKTNVIETAAAMGTLTKVGDGLYKTLKGNEVTAASFRENLKDDWFTADVLMKTLDKYGGFTNKLNEYYNKFNEQGLLTSEILDYTNAFIKGNLDIEKTAKTTGISVEDLTEMVTELSKAEYDLGRKSFAAAQEAKTFEEAIGATQDAVSTGWMKSFQLIFGDYKEAKKVWTALANELYDVFAAPGEFRNNVLSTWSTAIDEISGLTGRQMWFGDFEEQAGIIGNVWENVKSIVGAIKEGVTSVFGIFGDAEAMGTKLFQFSKWLRDVTSDLVLTEDQVESIKDAVAGLMRPVKTVVDLVMSVLKPTAKFVTRTVGYAVSTLVPEVLKFANVIGHLFKTISKNNSFAGITDKLERLYSGLSRVIRVVVDLMSKMISVPTTAIEHGLRAYERWLKKTESFATAISYAVKVVLKYLVRGIGQALTELTGIQWFTDFSEKIALGIDSISKKLKNFTDSIKEVYKLGGSGFRGVIDTILHLGEKAFKSATGWLTKVTGIKWFEEFGDNAVTNIQKARKSFASFFDEVSKLYSHYGGGATGFLHALFYESGKIARGALNTLADITGIEWLRTAGDKIFKFLNNLREHIAGFVESASTIFNPVKDIATGIFTLIFGTDQKIEDPTSDLADSVEENAGRMNVAYKSVAQMALEVIRGDWGNGIDRDNALWGAGYDNDRIQDVVNSIWTLTGEFKDGYQDILKEYENVDARMEGSILPIDPNSAKTKFLLHSGQILEEEVGRPIKSVGDQVADAKKKVFDGLVTLFTKLGETIAKLRLKVIELKQSFVDWIEREHIIDKFVDGIFNTANAVASFFTSVGGFIKSVWPTLKTFFTDATKRIIAFGKTSFRNTKEQLKSIGRLFKGTGTTFSDLINSIFGGDWEAAGAKITEIFAQIRKNYEKESKWFAYKMYKLHGPIAEFLKFIVIAKNVVVAAVKGITGGIKSLFASSEEGADGSTTAFGKFVNTIKGIGSFLPTVFAGTGGIFEKLQLSLLLSDWTTAGERFSEMLGIMRKNIDENYPSLSNTLTRMETFLNTYGPKFKTFGANVLAFLKTAGSAAWNGVKATWDGLKKTFEGTGWMFKNIFDGILEGNWGKIQKNLTYVWNTLWNNFKKVVSSAVDSIASKYPKLGAILVSIRDFIQKYSPMFKAASENIRKFFSSIGTTAFNTVIKVWSGLKTLFSGTGGLFSNLFTSLLGGDMASSKDAAKGLTRSLSANISTAYDAAITNAEENNPRLYGILKTIKAFKDNLVSTFDKLKKTVKEKFPSLKDSFIKGFEAIKNGFKNLLPMFGDLIGSLFKLDFKGVWNAVKGIFDYLYNAFAGVAKSFFTKLKNFFEPFFKDPLGVISNLIGKIGKAPKAIVEFFKDLLSFGSKENTGKTPSKVDLKKIKDAILGVLDVVRAVGGALSMFRAAAMFKSITGAAKGIGGLAESAKEVLDTKFLGKKSKVQTFVDTLKMLAIIFAVVVAAVIILGNQDPEVVQRGQEAAAKIAFAIVGFVVIIKLLDKILGKDSGSSFAKMGKSFLQLAVGLLVMYFAIKAFANIDSEVLMSGLYSLGLALFELVIFAKLITSKKGATPMDVGKQLLLCAVAIIVLCAAINILGRMDIKVLAQGFLAIAAILLAFGIFAQFLRSKSGQILKIGGTLIMLAAAMYVLTFAVEKFGNMDFEVLAKGVLAVVIGLVAMGVAVKLMKDVKASTAVVILALSAAMLILTSAVQNLGNMNLGDLAKGVGAMVILLGSLAGAAALLSASKPKFSTAFNSALLLGELLLAMYIAVQIMEEMQGEGYLEKAAALSLIVTTLGGVAALLSVSKPKFKEAFNAGIILAEVVVAAIAAALILENMNHGDYLVKATALSEILSVMGGVAALLISVNPDMEEAKGAAVAMMGMGVAAIEAAIAIDFTQDSEYLIEKAGALSMVLGSMGAVATGLIAVKADAKKGAKAAEALDAFMAIVIALLAVVGGINIALTELGSPYTLTDIIENAIEPLGAVGEAFGTMVGKFIGSWKASELETSQQAMSDFYTNFTAPTEEQQAKVNGVVSSLAELETQLPSKDGIFQYWFGGGTSWSTISDGLADFGKALAQFSIYCLLVNKESVTKGAEAGKALSETLDGLPETPGKISSWFEGTHEWSTISTGLADFGSALLKFSNACLLVNKASVQKGAEAGKALSETLEGLPETPGKISSWFEGTHEWSTISTGLVDFGEALVGFSKAVGGDNVSYDDVATAASAGLELAKVLNALPETPGFVTSWFVDTKNWGTISNGLGKFGEALAEFSTNTQGVTEGNTGDAVKVAGNLAMVARKIPATGGLYSLIFGEHNITDFANGIKDLGWALAQFSFAAGFLDTDASANAVTLSGHLVEISEKLPREGGFIGWLMGDYTMGEFATDVASLGQGLRDFSDKAVGINTTSVKFAVTIANSIATILETAQNFDTNHATGILGVLDEMYETAAAMDSISTDNFVTIAGVFNSISQAYTGEGITDDMTNLANDLLASFTNGVAAMNIGPGDEYDQAAKNFATYLWNRLNGAEGGWEARKMLLSAFKNAAINGVKKFAEVLNTNSEVTANYDTASTNFATNIKQRLDGTTGTYYADILEGFKTISQESAHQFSKSMGNQDTLDYFNGAFERFTNRVKNRIDGVNGTYREDILAAFKDLAQAVVQQFSQTLDSRDTTTSYNTAFGNFKNKVVERASGTSSSYRTNILEAFKTLAKDVVNEFANEFSSSRSVDRYNGSVNYLVSYLSGLLVNASNSLVGVVSVTISNGYNSIFHAARRAVQGIIDGFNSRYHEVVGIGANTMQGLINGMNALAPAVMGTAHSISSNVGASMARAMLVRSPSRVTTQLGEYIDEGLINGMLNKSRDVWNASSTVAIGVSDVMDGIIQNATYAMEQDANPTITPVVDMSNVLRSASCIDGILGGAYGYGLNPSITAAQAARVGTMSVTAQQVTRDTNYQESLESIRGDIRELSEAMQSMRIVMDSGALVGQLVKPMDAALGRQYVHQKRRN